jgi:hypothetical protein
MIAAELKPFPLCRYFLSEYLANREDPTNFPPDECPGVFQRYEEIFPFSAGYTQAGERSSEMQIGV